MNLDPEVTAAMATLSNENVPAPGDWKAFREMVATMYPVLTARLDRPEVGHQVFSTTSADGRTVDLHWFTPSKVSTNVQKNSPAVVHAHGGGLVAGSVDLLAPFLIQHVAASGVPALSVAYRLLPSESEGEGEGEGTPQDDVYAGLTWLIENAAELGVDPGRVAVMGESAGGGLAAATAVRAREAGLGLARQILIYPMLDDRTVTPLPHTEALDGGVSETLRVCWELLLGETRGTEAVPETLVAGRLKDHTGMPPAYLEVGELDLFRDDTVRYAAGLWAAGVNAELHVLPGMVHGWDHYAPRSIAFQTVFARRVAVLKSL